MNILIPTILSTNHKTGVGEYLINLIENLQQIDTQNHYYIITTHGNKKFFNFTNEKFHEIVFPFIFDSKVFYRLQYFIWHLLSLPIICKMKRIDIVHLPSPWFITNKMNYITTIHDIVELQTNKYSKILNIFKETMIKSSIKNSKIIITVSFTVKNQIDKLFSKNAIVVYNGVNKTFINHKLFHDIKRKYFINEFEYFCFIGTLLKHKNIINLIRGFSEYSKLNNNYKLIIIGKKENAYQEITNEINSLNMMNQVVLTGYLHDDIKFEILKNSKGLIFISNNEGFGLPLLEAQKLNVPVIAADIPVFREILKDSAIYVDPISPAKISEGIKKLVNNDKLSKELILRGKNNLKNFSWKESARKTLEVYTLISESKL